MSTHADDLSNDLGIRIAFTEFDGDRPFAQIFDKRTNEGLMNAKGDSWVEQYTNARFLIRGIERRTKGRSERRDRRQIVVERSTPRRRKTDMVIA